MSRARLTATVTRLTLAALALRIVLPAGFMPAAVGDGWFIQLCPQGLSPAAMEMLHPGHGGDHAAHHGSGEDGDASDDEAGSDAVFCPLGSLYSAATPPMVADAGQLLAAGAERLDGAALPHIVRGHAHYRSRAPPYS